MNHFVDAHITSLHALNDHQVEQFAAQLEHFVRSLRATGGMNDAPADRAGGYKLVKIGDLAQLSDASLRAFARELPSLVATLRLAASACLNEHMALAEAFPVVTYAPEIGDQVVIRSASKQLITSGNHVRAAELAGRTIDAAQRAARPKIW